VAGELHLSIHIDIEDATMAALQFNLLRAALFEFRPDTQGLGFMTSRGAIFDDDAQRALLGWGAEASRF
jgi:hypothetical protein